MTEKQPHIVVRDLTMAYGSFVIQHDLNFEVQHGDIFIIMGGSGCGKSTLLKNMVGLMAPAKGQVLYSGEDFWAADTNEREVLMRRFGILFQSSWQVAFDHHIGNTKMTTGFENPDNFIKGLLFIRNKVQYAVGNNHVNLP